MTPEAETLMHDAMISCTLLVGDCWPVLDVLERDPEYFEREAAKLALEREGRAVQP